MTVNIPKPAVRRIALTGLLAAASLSLSACAGMSRREASTVVGATAGAVVGGVVTGTTTGAALGAAAGGVIGNEVSKRR
ncbi:glycine zipper domain-containing protein [Roseateles saccharophilus]|uniref:Osmotically inducible lipoprotein OsmB n=1 Tax=Roseateles saccharophilus TaxID=304 RepID=A0A4R3VJ01_ROSSA|nr:glycine zipper domain-containing protein [Roseateles saccharophilus]MDG0831240.1 glycine zipper 2TM domain-containing protein [Roseateles saccharophilus]TCV04361.1 osmotically inducible lipoprotein OsmB [Roseateles saccharophilus]